MAIPIINDWEKYFTDPHEGLGSSYERIIINRLLLDTAQEYGVMNVLESPSFGFTGMSGINLIALADAGVEVTLEDDDPKRLDLISNAWRELGRSLHAVHNPGYQELCHPDGSFDMSFSFSALWFVPDLAAFLGELARVTKKVIFLSVPNRDGMGYKLQLKDYSPEKYPFLKIGNIDPPSIIRILQGLGWELSTSGYFDCPPWPDIGMTKEELLGKWLPACPMGKCLSRPKKQAGEQISILSYYSGRDPGFADRMLHYQWFEKVSPVWVKRMWAHHFHMVFEPRQGS
jgi:SAM-dependent methyltransferase